MIKKLHWNVENIGIDCRPLTSIICFLFEGNLNYGFWLLGFSSEVHMGRDVVLREMVEGYHRWHEGNIHQFSEKWTARNCWRRLGDERWGNVMLIFRLLSYFTAIAVVYKFYNSWCIFILVELINKLFLIIIFRS